MSNPKRLRQIAVRSVQANQFNFDDTNLKVSGYVNKTGKPSDPIPNWGETDEIPDDESFVEVMQPGVFRDAIQNADFVDFYLEHEPNRYLSSTQEGTLQLSEDSTGLRMSAKIVPTSWGQDTYTLIKNGVIKSMSFGFIPLEDQWDLTGDTPVRTVTKLQLLEVSAVRFPAYPDSSINARKKHFKRLNHLLEKRGLTLKSIHERGVNHMVKSTVKKRSDSSAQSSVDLQPVVSALGTLATSADNLTNAVQENSEVQKNIFAQLMQSANGDRAKKDVHKKSEKRDGKPKSEKPAKEADKPKNEKPSEKSEKPKETPKDKSKGETKPKETPKEKPSKEDKPAKEDEKTSEKPAPKDDERAKKAKDLKVKATKRAKNAKNLIEKIKGLNETV